MQKNTLFQKECEKLLSKLTKDDIEKFKKFTNEQERIKFVYNFIENIPLDIINIGKNFHIAEEEKKKGNNYFLKRNYENALKSYNRGIIFCTQNSDNERELLTILISNRSATFFDLKEYNKVLDDIDYLMIIGNYPQKLQYKIWLRKAKCYDALQNKKYSEEAYNLAISSLKYSELNSNDLRKKIDEIEKYRQNSSNDLIKINNEIDIYSHIDQFIGGNEMYTAAHKNVSFDSAEYFGRFARANDNIDSGVIIIEENPHCIVISSENALLNCQHCCLSTNKPIACPNCCSVVFCCLNCERQSNATYHKFECQIQPIIFHYGISINCSMALRMISQKPFKYFQDNQKLLKDYLNDNCKKVAIKRKYHRSDDYLCAFFLCRNEFIRDKTELLHYSCMATYFLKLLKFVGYFEISNNNSYDDEIFIGSLMLRHLQILQFNSHEISELRNCLSSKTDLYENVYIGAGLYPTLALFNHSCEPSIVRYNIGSKMIARTIKPIKAGEIIYENYGPIYTTMEINERHSYLKERYWFDCYCIPCENEWPLFENMNENQIKFPCQNSKCKNEFIVTMSDCLLFLQCDSCNTTTNIFPYLKQLSSLEILLVNAEELYRNGECRKAINAYNNCLNILYKNSNPPCPDMVKVQQRLRNLLMHFGNKSYDYVQKL